jgi:hypothetical protein
MCVFWRTWRRDVTLSDVTIRKKIHHKVHAYLEYRSVYPLVRIGNPPPLSRKRICPPEPERMDGTHSHACEGVGESQFGRLEKILALWLLCEVHYP